MYLTRRLISEAYILPSFLRMRLSTTSTTDFRFGKVGFEELKSELEKKKVLYVDVRNLTELKEEGKISGSYHIPLNEISTAFSMTEEEFFAKYQFSKPDISSSNLVLGCRYAVRSVKAGEMLWNLGYKSIRIYSGGFEEWKAKDGPITK